LDTNIEQLIEAVKSATKEWLTPNELESEFSISTSTQAKLRCSKSIPYHKIGKYVRYKRADINQWFDSAKVV
jgi:predicted DNA-binding transcriptional regulator AlpA